MNLYQTDEQLFTDITYEVPDFMLSAVFNDDVSGFTQSEANAALAFLYETIQDLRKQGYVFCHWAVKDQEQEPTFRKYHDMNHLGIDATNCIDLTAYCRKIAD